MSDLAIVIMMRSEAKEVGWRVVCHRGSGLYCLISKRGRDRLEQYKPTRIENIAAEIYAHKKRLQSRCTRKKGDYLGAQRTPAYWKDRRTKHYEKYGLTPRPVGRY